MAETLITTFALDAPVPAADWVLRRGKIFEAGAWPDKDFALTPADLAAAVAAFAPVPVDLEHTPTVLDGKLGELRALELTDEGRTLVGTVALPAWLDAVLQDGARRVSCTWDRATKQLAGLALVNTPRISDAALFAAFAGARHSAADLADMQAIHDLVTKQGATCNRRNVTYTAPLETKPMSLKAQLLALFGQLPDEDPVIEGAAPVEPAPALVEPATPQVPPAEFAAMQAERDALAAQLAATQTAERQTAAVAFAETQITAAKAYPAERATLIALYRQALTDDAAQAVTVTFGAEDTQTGSRVDALTALLAARPAHHLTQETVAAFAHPADQRPDAAQAQADRQAALLASTPLGQHVLAAIQSHKES